MNWYCDVAPGHEWHGPYHENEYGFPVTDDQALFERLSLEIFQAGLSWLLVLKKRQTMKAAFADFVIEAVANFDDDDRARLLADAGVIRNRLKINAIIYNANVLLTLQTSHGSFSNWLDAHHPLEKLDWLKLFKKHFKFVGGEIVGEFLMSTGYLPGAHRPDCPVNQRLVELHPPWMNVPKKNDRV